MEGGAFQTYAATSGLSLNLYLCLCSFPSFSSLATLFFLSLALSLSLSFSVALDVAVSPKCIL